MKKTIFLFSLILSLSVQAQTIVYPEEVKAVFSKADAEITASYATDGRTACKVDHDDLMTGPRIAVPACTQAVHIKEMIKAAGGIPVDFPDVKDQNNAASILHSKAFSWDGAVLPENWVSENNTVSVLVYKTIADFNIPCLGSSPLTRKIDDGLRRMTGEFSSMEGLVRKARTYRKAKVLMDGLFSIDTHCDLPDEYSRGFSVGKRTLSQCSIPKMDEGHLDSQVLISFLWQGPTDEASSQRAVEKNLRQIESIKEDIAKYPGLCGLARTPDEALALKAEGKKAFFIGLENGYGIGTDLENIKKMKELGVIYITLCHFRDNSICNTSSRHGSNPSKGLTEYGLKVIEEMNRQGIMIDLSHPSPGTFWDCIKHSKAPVICSHSGARAIYGHDRGLDDRQLKALAENGGVIQVYSVADFLGRDASRMTIDDMMKHFNHCVEVAGDSHVGIGSDFDGGGGVIGCNGDNDLINITVKMLEHGYSPSQIEGFWGGNFMRVMKEVQAIADQD